MHKNERGVISLENGTKFELEGEYARFFRVRVIPGFYILVSMRNQMETSVKTQVKIFPNFTSMPFDYLS